MKISDSNIENKTIEPDKQIFLKKQLLIIAIAIIGVKLSGCGINLDAAKINISPMGKISFFKFIK